MFLQHIKGLGTIQIIQLVDLVTTSPTIQAYPCWSCRKGLFIFDWNTVRHGEGKSATMGFDGTNQPIRN
jgi:hypothetical protein